MQHAGKILPSSLLRYHLSDNKYIGMQYSLMISSFYPTAHALTLYRAREGTLIRISLLVTHCS